MNTHIIILAQGAQTRLPELPVAKQLLPLPACGDTPILYRTLRQVWEIMCRPMVTPGADGVTGAVEGKVTVVAGYSLMEHLMRNVVVIPTATGSDEGYRYTPNVTMLADPGNSSLKGIDHFLRIDDLTFDPPSEEKRPSRTVVLLGDVIYSWVCLRAIFSVGAPWCTKFVGSSNLSRGGGELWGLSWSWEAEHDMRSYLAHALLKHPPFADYQPGQMRRWLWAANYSRRSEVEQYRIDSPWFVAVDDYTKDIDIPEHLPFLPPLSEAARVDDAAHGVTW